MNRHRPLLLFLLAPVALGCSASVNVGDGATSGSKIADDIRAEDERQSSLTLRRLTCEEAEGEKGAPIRCTGTNSEDVDLTIRGEVTEIDGGRVHFRWRVAEAFAPGRELAEEARRRLEQQVGQRAKDLTCPGRIRLRAGETVRCTLETLDGLEFGVTLTLTDERGSFDVAVDDRPTRQQ